MSEVAELHHLFGRIRECWTLYRTDVGVPRGIDLSLADKDWSRTSVQYSTHWCWHGTILSDGRGELVASLWEEAHRIKAALLVRYFPFESIGNRIIFTSVNRELNAEASI